MELRPHLIFKDSMKRYAGLVLSPILLAACTQSVSIPKSQEVQRYYPELLASKYQVKALDNFSTTTATIRWINFSNRHVDSDALQSTIRFFDQVGKAPIRFNYQFLGQEFIFRPLSRGLRRMLMFFVPDDTPNRDPNTPLPDNLYISTIAISNNNNDIPQNSIFQTQEQIDSKKTTTEACQASITITSNTTSNANLGQEIMCNSLAWALTAKQILPSNSDSYQKYTSAASTTQITPNGNTFFPLYIVSSSFYNSIPADKLVITSNQ